MKPETFKITVIHSFVDRKRIEDDVRDLKRFIKDRFTFELSVRYLALDIPVRHKSFGISKIVGDRLQELWGLDGTKDLIRPAISLKTNKYDHHAVFFVYKLDRDDDAIVANWTTFAPLFPWCEFVEIPFKKEWDDKRDLFRVFTHEIFHVFHNRLRRQGIVTKDTMDEYDDEFSPTSATGNRARNVIELRPYASTLLSQPILVELLKAFVAFWKPRSEEIEAEPTPIAPAPEQPIVEAPRPSRLDLWAEAIKEFEGWTVGSRSYRNLNPGNLRYSPFEIGTDGGFAVFKDYATGWKALKHQLTIAATGKSKVYRPTMTLLQFFKVYAPSNDGNHPENYANYVAKRIGVPVSVPISSLV